jgi:hypothetical protein
LTTVTIVIILKLKDIRSDVEALIVGLNLKKKALDTYQKLRIGDQRQLA